MKYSATQFIRYRPEWNMIFGGVTQALFIEQLLRLFFDFQDPDKKELEIWIRPESPDTAQDAHSPRSLEYMLSVSTRTVYRLISSFCRKNTEAAPLLPLFPEEISNFGEYFYTHARKILVYRTFRNAGVRISARRESLLAFTALLDKASDRIFEQHARTMYDGSRDLFSLTYTGGRWSGSVTALRERVTGTFMKEQPPELEIIDAEALFDFVLWELGEQIKAGEFHISTSGKETYRNVEKYLENRYSKKRLKIRDSKQFGYKMYDRFWFHMCCYVGAPEARPVSGRKADKLLDKSYDFLKGLRKHRVGVEEYGSWYREYAESLGRKPSNSHAMNSSVLKLYRTPEEMICF